MVIAIFIFVYLGMMLGRFPGLALDRTGIALLGAIALLAGKAVGVGEAWNAIDVPTLGLLFGLMVVSAQFRLAGAYTAIARRIAASPAGPQWLLALVIAASGVLSALLANDIVCLAFAPLIVEGFLRRGLDPRPHLLALACASNIGSAATLIGNPQNMLIGQTLGLSFAGYLLDGGVPAVLGLVLLWLWLRKRAGAAAPAEFSAGEVEAPVFNPWQAGKGLAILLVLVAAFIFSQVPREILALAAGGIILLSRRMHSRHMLGLVDWQLLVLFVGLFIVNHALQAAGHVEHGLAGMRSAGIDAAHPGWLFAVTVVLSNLVSNVPAVMLLLPVAAHPAAGPILALASTLAGNLIIVGSIANIIVVEQAQRLGVRISWREHARVGIPVTLLTLAIAAGWIGLRAMM